METTQKPNSKMNKLWYTNTMEYIHNSHENEQTTSTSNKMNKSQRYDDEWKRPDTKNTGCMIPFVWNSKLTYESDEIMVTCAWEKQ